MLFSSATTCWVCYSPQIWMKPLITLQIQSYFDHCLLEFSAIYLDDNYKIPSDVDLWWLGLTWEQAWYWPYHFTSVIFQAERTPTLLQLFNALWSRGSPNAVLWMQCAVSCSSVVIPLYSPRISANVTQRNRLIPRDRSEVSVSRRWVAEFLLSVNFTTQCCRSLF